MKATANYIAEPGLHFGFRILLKSRVLESSVSGAFSNSLRPELPPSTPCLNFLPLKTSTHSRRQS
jgi:hypothetical protein